MFSKHQKHHDATLGCDVEDSKNEPVTIQISLGGINTQNFRFGREILTGTIALTFISALWGTGMAWWIAWSYLSGAESEKQQIQAKMVAAEV